MFHGVIFHCVISASIAKQLTNVNYHFEIHVSSSATIALGAGQSTQNKRGHIIVNMLTTILTLITRLCTWMLAIITQVLANEEFFVRQPHIGYDSNVNND